MLHTPWSVCICYWRNWEIQPTGFPTQCCYHTSNSASHKEKKPKCAEAAANSPTVLLRMTSQQVWPRGAQHWGVLRSQGRGKGRMRTDFLSSSLRCTASAGPLKLLLGACVSFAMLSPSLLCPRQLLLQMPTHWSEWVRVNIFNRTSIKAMPVFSYKQKTTNRIPNKT